MNKIVSISSENMKSEKISGRQSIVRRHWYALAAGGLILCGVALRLTLIIIGWPHTNSEEGTMGLEAMHILMRGAHPIYYYGQNYMGVGEAYLGALAFRVFGITVFSLRLGMISLYAVFMLGVFWLAHLLYSRRVALVSLAALIGGTPFVVRIELLADGGKAETLAFGAMMFALASWLALSRPAAQASRRRRALRYAALVAWGVTAGFGLYTYAIIAPFVLASSALIWLALRRESPRWVVALPIVGLMIGLLPAILYTVTTPLADNPIAVFLSLHESLNAQGSSGENLLGKQIVGTLLYTLPTVTGLINFYPVQALPLFGPPSRSTVTATLIGGAWSLGYLSLLGIATYRPLRALWRNGLAPWITALLGSRAVVDAPAQPGALSVEIAQYRARDVARLMLTLTAWLTIAAYMFSATAANNPYSGRYMIGLLVIMPALLWPLVDRASQGEIVKAEAATRARALLSGKLWRAIGVAALGVTALLNVAGTAQSVPDSVAANYRDARFAHDLLSHGITRFYSDYWTCDLLNFETREQLTCAVINEYAQPGLTRYHPYYAEVKADPGAPYVLARGSIIERTFLIHAAEIHQRYSVQYLDGHSVYTPVYT